MANIFQLLYRMTQRRMQEMADEIPCCSSNENKETEMSTNRTKPGDCKDRLLIGTGDMFFLSV